MAKYQPGNRAGEKNRERKTGAEKTGTEAEITEDRNFGCMFGSHKSKTEISSVSSVIGSG